MIESTELETGGRVSNGSGMSASSAEDKACWGRVKPRDRGRGFHQERIRRKDEIQRQRTPSPLRSTSETYNSRIGSAR